jgi:hypothetical protein
MSLWSHKPMNFKGGKDWIPLFFQNQQLKSSDQPPLDMQLQLREE